MHTKRRRPIIVKYLRYKYLLVTLIGILLVITMTLTACAKPAPAPAPEPESELALYEAHKAIETRLDAMATNSEAQRYLSDFMDLTEGFWEPRYIEQYKQYYITAKALRDIPPNTYYYQSYWSEAMWVLDSGGHISPDANARRLEADLQKLSEGGVIEPNPNYSP